PVVSNLQTITSEAARMTTLAAAQVERADRMFADLTRRAEQVMAAVPTLLGPAGKGLAFLNGIKAALAAIHELRRSSRRGRDRRRCSEISHRGSHDAYDSSSEWCRPRHHAATGAGRGVGSGIQIG